MKRYILRLEQVPWTASIYGAEVVCFDAADGLTTTALHDLARSGRVVYRAVVDGYLNAERVGLEWMRRERPAAKRVEGPAGPINLWEEVDDDA